MWLCWCLDLTCPGTCPLQVRVCRRGRALQQPAAHRVCALRDDGGRPYDGPHPHCTGALDHLAVARRLICCGTHTSCHCCGAQHMQSVSFESAPLSSTLRCSLTVSAWLLLLSTASPLHTHAQTHTQKHTGCCDGLHDWQLHCHPLLCPAAPVWRQTHHGLPEPPAAAAAGPGSHVRAAPGAQAAQGGWY